MSIQSILSASNSLSKLQTMQNVNSRNEGQINVLKAEIKSDGGNEHKEAKVEELSEKSSALMDNLMNELSDVNESMKPENDTEETDKKEEAAKEPKTDKIELSAQYAKTDGVNKQEKSVTIKAEPVTYNSDGEKAAEQIMGTDREINELV